MKYIYNDNDNDNDNEIFYFDIKDNIYSNNSNVYIK